MRKLLTGAIALTLVVGGLLQWGYSLADFTSTQQQSTPEERLLSPEEATQAALRHVLVESATIAEWRDCTVSLPVEHYDLQGNASAYVFSILKEGQDRGYVVISARRIPNVVLEFSTGTAKFKKAVDMAEKIVIQQGFTNSDLLPLYLGPLLYFYEIKGQLPRQLIDMSSGEQFRISGSTPSSLISKSIPSLSTSQLQQSDIALAATLPTDVHYKLLDVPDYNQYQYDGCAVGCAPTAAGNVMGYWADRGYPNLMSGGSGGDYQSTINGLHDHMHTFCSDGEGGTYVSDIGPGIVSYADTKGYSFTSRWIEVKERTDEAFDSYVFEINADRPLVVVINDSTCTPDGCMGTYRKHAVTGAGYQYDPNNEYSKYMIVHDNWDCSTKDVFVQYAMIQGEFFLLPVWPPTITPPPTPSPYPSTDSATLISDVTLPDGSAVSPGQALVKTWRVKNIGTSTWSGYKLRFVGGDRMNAPTETSIQNTAPQSTVDISINLTASTQPGNYSGYFQIVNASGTEVPGGRLWVKISVQAEESRITFYFDPPSPSAANNVYIKAKAEGIGNVRAMRLLIDGQIVSELGAIYVDANWDTQAYADGLHSIVAQVAFWGDDGWAYPEQRGISYELLPGRAPTNKAPNPPTLTQPGDWHVGWSIPQLCAQHNGDPDGDAVTHYYFEIFESFQNWNSGWITSNCVTPSGLASTNYQWHVKVRDSHGAESDWSQAWHFSYLDPTPQITQFDFDPPSPSNAEEIWIHTNGTGNVNETIVTVNMATDCSDSGEWHGINHFAGGLDVDSYWSTLDIPAGCHKVRVQLKGVGGVTYQDKDYVLNDPRRPKVPYEIYPVRNQWVNTRIVTFRWEPSLRQDSYRLIVSTNSDPGADPSPLVNQTWTTDVTGYTGHFSADYAALYYRIQATNAQGSTDSTVRFGIDTTPPNASMPALPAISLDTQIPVSWSAGDALSGVRWYDVQVRDGLRGEWTDWLVHTTRTSEIFPARPGHTYYFRVRAMDVAGNTDDYPGGDGHTHTLVDPTAAPPTAWWNGSYGLKRNILIVNQDSQVLPVHFPIHLHFDSSTSPTAQELYNASLSSTKGNDVRVVYNDTTELDRFAQRFSATQIDIWFPLQAQIAGSGSDGESYQLYCGNASAGSPPADVNDVFLPVADANTIGLWHFQNGSGSNVTDTSGRGHHGAFQNAAWTDGWLGWAGSFNGSSAYVDAGNSNDFNLGNGPMTIEAWIYLTGNTGNYPHVVSKWGPGDGSYFFRINNQRELHWLLRADGGNREVVTWGYDPLELNTWYHVAVTYDGNSTMRTFINGQQKRTNTNAADAFNSTRRLFIGWAEQGADGGYFPGYIQHVRISNVERTSFPYGRVTNAPSVAAGSAILPPSSGSANLVLQSLSTYPVDSETLEGSIIVQAIVKNDGNAPTVNGFYTDFYANHLPTGGGDLNGSIRFLVNESIVAGATVTLTTVISDMTGVSGLSAAVLGPSSETTVTLYTQADSEGVITEPDEADNISSGVDVCVASADAYESDNTFADAQSITLGGTQRHNFDSLSDQDWVKFTAQGGAPYTIRTSDLGPAADTYLYLYDTDGSTLLAANDDYGGSLASRIEWTSPMTGTYYVLVKHWNPTVMGCGTGYDLTLEKALANRIYLPVISRNFAPSTPWPGNALSLNGVDGYVFVNDNDSLDGFSEIAVEAWVRTNDSSGAKAIVSKYRHYSGSNWDDSFYLSLSGGRVEWQLNAGDSYSIANGNTNVADGQWHHIAGTWDGTNQVIYVDGSQDASRTYSGNGQINSTDEPITIGRSIDFGGPGRYLSGQIDDVRIWNLARSQQDIRSTRFQRLQGNEAGLIAYWPMDEAIGSTAVPDVSGHSNDGTLRGGAGLVVSTVPTN